ncbi:ATP-binding protein [Mucilaginibacter sp.]|uniref:ATP-binding protein n=1 Tax=Mucilaginibacter sp. TaxID=1882438 RepID=UPI0025F96A45|nr:ATP-binding protein [Mucilaginibacter sp.]
MKQKLFLLLILLPIVMFGQKNSTIKVDSLNGNGFLLDKGWKYLLDDKPEYANIDFNDTSWKSVDPTRDIFDLPQIPKTGKIFWLRLHLSIDSSLNNQLVMLIKQSGASAIYLNGKLIHHFGILSNNAEKVEAFAPANNPVSFPVLNQEIQVLAVRYAFQPGIRYTTIFQVSNKCLAIKLVSIDNGTQTLSEGPVNLQYNIALACIFAVLSLLYFTFYLSYTKQVINLYFSIYALLSVVNYVLAIIIMNSHYIASWYWAENFSLGINVVSLLFLLVAIYKLIDQKADVFFFGLPIFGVICIPFALFEYKWGWLVFGGGFIPCMSADVLRIAIKAVRKNKRGAWIITVGAFIFFFFWLLFLGASATGSGEYLPYFFAISQLGIPLSVSIYIGFDFAQTNLVLERKLVEVENLSAEKQQILATQNETLEQQVTARTSELEYSFNELKATQTQLVQREKMASLGELTAGIAHEIQNPLNFVNNFSEVNTELIDEMQEGIDKGDYEEVKAIANDIKENQQKINQHGKRADAIVKGMLEHSRNNSGQKEPTDLNVIAEEFMRLSYHGLRAKDKSFNAELITHFDPGLPKIEVVQQDIGRVMLNLFNNAFYAVNQKAKTAGSNYKPTVEIKTFAPPSGGWGAIVRDNGIGIPDAIKEKIMQPFFTTKPTGEGTGLGLSLSYEIVVKAHGGKLEVESEDGKYTEFKISIPI